MISASKGTWKQQTLVVLTSGIGRCCWDKQLLQLMHVPIPTPTHTHTHTHTNLSQQTEKLVADTEVPKAGTAGHGGREVEAEGGGA